MARLAMRSRKALSSGLMVADGGICTMVVLVILPDDLWVVGICDYVLQVGFERLLKAFSPPFV